jgi:intracellular sulfur oxidation DsrE/DsrF family protein
MNAGQSGRTPASAGEVTGKLTRPGEAVATGWLPAGKGRLTGRFSWLKHAVANVTNLIKDAGEAPVRAAILANGKAVEVFKPGNGLASPLGQLVDQGVEVLACRNSLRALGMDEGELPGFVKVVPAGITELVRRQQEGWAYVRP